MSENKRGSTWNSRAMILAAIAICSLALNLVQFVFSRLDRQSDAVLEAWRNSPSVSFQYWTFRGGTWAVCDFFTPELQLSVQELSEDGYFQIVPGRSIRTVRTQVTERVTAKRNQVCSTDDPIKNDARDWQFLLIRNDWQRTITASKVTYGNQSEDELNVGIEPSGGVLLPLGFSLVGQETRPTDYSVPAEFFLAWEGPTEPLTKTLIVPQPGGAVLGYVLDSEDGLVFSAAPWLE